MHSALRCHVRVQHWRGCRACLNTPFTADGADSACWRRQLVTVVAAWYLDRLLFPPAFGAQICMGAGHADVAPDMRYSLPLQCM